jgi:hypothetical protein
MGTRPQGMKGKAATRGGRRTDSMDVSLDRSSHLPVDDERDVGDVDTSTSLIGHNEEKICLDLDCLTGWKEHQIVAKGIRTRSVATKIS